MHQNNRRLIADCLIAAALSASLHAQNVHITIDAAQTGHRLSRYLTGACIEDVNHEIYGGIDSQLIFGESFAEPALSQPLPGFTTFGGLWTQDLPFPMDHDGIAQVSGQWRSIQSGSARGAFSLDTGNPFSGKQSQRLDFISGEGTVGIENQSLNRWGMNLVKGKSYQGRVWVRSPQPTEFCVALESGDGTRVFAEQSLTAVRNDWQQLDFALIPSDSHPHGRFSIKLKHPSSIAIGFAFLQPGPWGLFNGLPTRKDVAEGLVAQGVTILRYGGCMANAAEYRWKNMIGQRDRRPPYKGWWYPYSSNGWGIFEFLNLCESAGIAGIPDVNMGESPTDMADFMEYANGPANSPWGRKRAADGHPDPYQLRHLQLGNEERVNGDYWLKFKPMAEAIWAKDKDVILVVGDFAYQKPIADPFDFDGADSKITSMQTQRNILQLAKQHNREVWFDVHVWTEGPRPSSSLDGAISYRDALDRIADGARFQVVVFELNANNPNQRRALANAIAIQRAERDGRLPVVLSANCLQPDGQNDNGWNQGLLFLNPEKVWLQPPGYITRMIASHYQPISLPVKSDAAEQSLDISAKRSEDGKTLVIQVVNPGDAEQPAVLDIKHFTPTCPSADVEELAGPLDLANTADNTHRIHSKHAEWTHGLGVGASGYTFPPRSFTVLTFR